MSDDYMGRYYRQLMGATIIGYMGSKEEEFGRPFPNFLVQMANGKRIVMEISSDPEGNEGGFIFGLPLPKDTDASN